MLFALLALVQLPELRFDAPRTRLFVGQELEVRVEFVASEAFVATELLQLFPQALELPVQLEVPWSAGLDGAEVELLTDEDPREPRLALGEEIVRCRRRALDAGRSAYGLSWRVTPLRAGPLLLAAPAARYASATRFADDLVHGRVPLDRVEHRLQAEPRTLEVLALPEAGRPPTFEGAIGPITIAAELDAARARVGEALALTVELDGPGRPAARPAPRFDRLAGFHLRALRREEHGSRARFLVELVPTRPVSELPAIEYAYFDPERESYGVARAPPIALDVRVAGGGPASVPAPGPEGGLHRGGAGVAVFPALLVTLAGAALLLVAAVVLFVRLRRRRA